MIKSTTKQLIFQTIYCVLAIIGVLNSVGYFKSSFNQNFYVYYTNLSNYICAVMMFIFLFDTIKRANKKEDGLCTKVSSFNFMCVIMILVTFLVYNVLLADEYTVIEYFTTQGNLIMHLILPIMYIVHWALFCEHKKLKWYHPLMCTIMPLVYVAFILVRAPLAKASSVIYPYFFLDVSSLGWGGFFGWIAVLFVVFVALGYVLFALDHFSTIKEKIKQRKENKSTKD